MQAEKKRYILGKTLEFKIPFKGLSIGFHEFTYEVNDLFFEKFDYSEIKKGQIRVDLTLEKQEKILVLNFSLNGTVEVNCDRCLEPFDHAISGKQQLLINFGDSFKEETDEMITISRNDYEIDIAPFVYEYIHLLIPIQCIHSADENGNETCNNEVIDKLNELKSQDQTDPRWEALKNLKKHN